MNRPWMKFHTRDWLDNKELRRCSPVSRSVLADLMCLAAEGVPYGHLADKVGPLTEAYMASRCVVSLAKFRSAVQELLGHERLHKEGDVFFVKRMVDDEDVRVRRSAGGSASIGHPSTHPPKSKEGYPQFEIDSRERALADSGSDSSSVVGVKKKKDENFFEVLAGENGFTEWRKLCEEIGVSGSEPDWNRAASAWRHLDFEQKNEAMKGVEARRGIPDDPLVNSLPYNIIADKKWQRKVRDPTRKKSAGEQYLDDREAALIREREARST